VKPISAFRGATMQLKNISQNFLTDAFAKYTLVTEIAYKKAETVDDTMYKEWFSKFSIPTQIHMDGGKEFNV